MVSWKSKGLFCLFILINIIAVLAGAYYYIEQLLFTPGQLLLFVPDCPLYVLLFLIVALGLVRNSAFSFLVSVGMAKYGLWTVFVLLFHWNYYSTPSMLAITLLFIAGHIGMALEGLAVLPKKRIGALALAIIIGWFLLNDYMDYAVGTVPIIPPAGMPLVAALTVAASIIIPLALCKYPEKARTWQPVAFLKKVIDSKP